MYTQPKNVEFRLPQWIENFTRDYKPLESAGERMQFVISASEINVLEGTGGPFAAAIFEIESGVLVSLGVNLVTSEGLSILHAEMVAIAIAQRKLNTYDLGSALLPQHELVTSTEPCAMCFGAIPWSGVRSVVTAARDSDARAIGFDEGPKLDDWAGALESRGISVKTNIERSSARAILDSYIEKSGHIYNSREK